MGTGTKSGVNWIQTFTGKRFDYLAPSVDDVCIEDIAHALSLQARYNGHLTKFYSVAQHCIHVATLCEEFAVAQDYSWSNMIHVARWGLLHDAAEAYVGDIPSPLKALLPEFKRIESDIQVVICCAFDLAIQEPLVVKQFDLEMLGTETEWGFADGPRKDWGLTTKSGKLPAPRPELRAHMLSPMSPEVAEEQFLSRFRRLFKAQGVTP